MQLQTGPNDTMRRLDRILRKALPDLPLSLIHRLLRQGKILVNNKRAQMQERIPAGALIQIPDIAHCPSPTPHSPPPIPQLPAMEILRQDSNLLILNKPAGIAVHGPESLDTQVQQYLAGHLCQAENASLSFRPGPLHRLDKPTSGIVVFSASLEGARNFSLLMREGKIQKYYLAVAEGCLDTAETWQDTLVRDSNRKRTAVVADSAQENSVSALTTVQPLAASVGTHKDQYTLILAQPHSGRTHQIRAQAAFHGHPLMNDRKYSARRASPFPVPYSQHPITNDRGLPTTFFLHAWKLNINNSIEATAPLPQAFESVLHTLFSLDITDLNRYNITNVS